MKVRQAIRASLGLLASRGRRRLILLTLAQMSTAFLDLIGIALVGVVTALAMSDATGSEVPLPIATLLNASPFQGSSSTVKTLLLALIAGVFLIGKSGLSIYLSRRVLRFLAGRQVWVSWELSSRLLGRPLLDVQQLSSQQIVYALTSGVAQATTNILSKTSIIFVEAALLTVLAVGLFYVSPLVTFFSMAFFLAIALALHRILAKRAGRIGLALSALEVQSIESVQEALRAYREAVVSGTRPFYVERFAGIRRRSAFGQAELEFLNMVPKYVLEISLVIGAGGLAVSQLATEDTSAAIAIIAVFLAAGSRIVPSMLRLQTAMILIRGSAGQAQQTFELAEELALSAPLPVVSPRRPWDGPPPAFQASVGVVDVSFQYPGAKARTLTDISLSVAPGQSLALVGSTGAGKTTLADVILGIIEPDEGSVEVSGVSPSLAIAAWPGAIAYVPQHIAMANGTVRDNVALGLPSEAVDDEAVWSALRRAHLESLFKQGRDGLATLIGEHGIKLSGGQRQRLGIARALFTKPKLLVLDEATSALDAETEQSISRTLSELSGQVTTIVIAHRLATVRNCDLVAYLEGGRIQALGSFNEVREVSSSFRRQAEISGL